MTFRDKIHKNTHRPELERLDTVHDKNSLRYEEEKRTRRVGLQENCRRVWSAVTLELVYIK